MKTRPRTPAELEFYEICEKHARRQDVIKAYQRLVRMKTEQMIKRNAYRDAR